jgi:hypothetical protein
VVGKRRLAGQVKADAFNRLVVVEGFFDEVEQGVAPKRGGR